MQARPPIKKTQLRKSRLSAQLGSLTDKMFCSVGAKGRAVDAPTDKTIDEIQQEIQAIIRQITASVTFLPVLEGRHSFNVLVYADGDAQVPAEWIDSDPKEVQNAEQVKLRSFSTASHRVDTMVAYRLGTVE